MTELLGYARYAIYFAPPAGSALARLGASWLGWDAEAGAAAPRPPTPTLPRPAESLTAAPARYGFHATLKAPFRLARGRDAHALDAALAGFAAACPPAAAPRLRLRAEGGFVALRPDGPSPELDALARAVTRALDPCRAPLSETERQSRLRAGLTPAQRTRLERWGYPYLDEDFRFHMTLTGPVSASEAEAVIAALSPLFGPALTEPPRVEDICLFGDPGQDDRFADQDARLAGQSGRFRLLRRYALEG